MAEETKSVFVNQAKRQIMSQVMPTLICSACKKVPGPEKQANKRYTCVRNAHTLCQDCNQKRACHCGSTVSQSPSPLFEELIDCGVLYCSNYSDGCREVYSDASQHQMHCKSCSFRTVPCVFQSLEQCQDGIVFKDMHKHLKVSHNERIVGQITMKREKGGWTLQSLQKFFGKLGDKISWNAKILSCGPETFILAQCLKNGSFSSWIISLETLFEARNYEYSIKAKGKNGEKVMYEGKCCTSDDFENELGRKELYFTMRNSVLEHFLNEERRLGMEIKITNLKEQEKNEDVESGISDDDNESSAKKPKNENESSAATK